MDPGLEAFVRDERLPPEFARTYDRICRPLAQRAAELRTSAGRTVVMGLCGAQGSGKSTLAAATVGLLEAGGLRALTLSIDDVYLGREARAWLAGRVHPLLAVRGPPGTHDVALACAVLDGLATSLETPIPAFDKATDERRPKREWRTLEGPLDVVILEGWCVGARPQPTTELRDPVNDLEAVLDGDGTWRRYVNDQLAGPYPALFGRLDHLTLLQAPGFDVVRGWRTEQEHKLRARTGYGMDDVAVERFVQHYERLTRWIQAEMPGRADWTVPLGLDRAPHL